MNEAKNVFLFNIHIYIQTYITSQKFLANFTNVYFSS